ncbi:glycerol-3-phosphate 1-O-acyltransferase PlsY [Nitrospiraceae bacterium AH_259_D15_M11_P09]|nr:glycerol-3-phosphate 1-O-acyltransferase PlsY [Nitrospiraceae bacterium AH_259_D15_M11_P09]
MRTEWLVAALAVGGYLLGSIPFGVLVCKSFATVDPRTAGSYNIGFSNVLRVAGKRAGVLTLIGDMGKGWLVGGAARYSLDHEPLVLLAALCPILGHMHSVFLRFSGGKGVATALGAVVGVAPAVGAALLGLWLASVAVWRISSVGALVAFASFPVVAILMGRSWAFVAFAAVVSGMIVWKHKENVVRLWAGTEA